MNDWSLEGSSPPHRTGHEGAGVTVVRVLTRRYGLPRRQLQLPAPPPPQVPLMYAMGGGRPLAGPPPGSGFVPRRISNCRLGKKGPFSDRW